MDPFSLALGGITVCQVAGKVISLGIAYGKSVANLPEDVQTLISEIALLSGVLNTLCTSLQKDKDDTTPRLIDADMLSGPIEECRLQLEELHALLAKDRSKKNRLRNFGRRLKWPLKEKDTAAWIERIERHKTTFSLAVQTEELGVTRKICTDVTEIKIAQESDRIEKKKAVQSESYREALAWLSTTDPRENHLTARKLQTKGTGRWFTESSTFAEWKQAESSFIWLYGNAGAGKTILSSIIIDRLLEDDRKSNIKTMFYFCDFRNIDKMSAAGVYGSLTAQILQANWENDMPPDFEYFYNTNKSRPPQADLLKEQLLQLVKNIGRTRIVVDALDECDASQRIEVLQTLLEIRDAGKFNILVTSRQEVDIKLEVENEMQLCIQASVNTADINLFVTSELERNHKLKRLNEETKSEIVSNLITGANGMFRWAKCSIDQLSRLRNTKAIKEALKSLPTGLYETYDRILEGISKDDQELALRAFNWLVCSTKPLQVRQLVEAIAIELGDTSMDPESLLNDPGDLLDICGSLVTVDHEAGTVVLAHFSVKEYLTSSGLKDSAHNTFFIDLHQKNIVVAKLCITYLCFGDFSGGAARDGAELAQRFENHALYLYAALHWPNHAKVHQDRGDRSFLSMVENFFLSPNMDPNFVSWTQALNALENLDRHYDHYLGYDQGPNRLVYACRFGLLSTAQMLIDKGVDIHAVCKSSKDSSRFSYEYGTALNAACASGNLQLVEYLVSKGADVNAMGGNSELPIFHAFDYGNRNGDDFTIMEWLLEHGANVNLVTPSGRWPLLHVVYNYSAAGVRILAKYEPDLSLRNGNDMTVLEAASVCGGGGVNQSVYQALVEIGAGKIVSPDLPEPIPSGTDSYALIPAAQCNYFEVAEQIIAKDGATILTEPGFKWVNYIVNKHCANKGFYMFLKNMISRSRGAEIYNFEELLADAAVQGHLNTVDVLLEAWEKSEGSKITGYPLVFAAARGHKDVVERLLKHKDPEAPLYHGWSAVLAASVYKQPEILEFFRNINPSLVPSNAKTAISPTTWTRFHPFGEKTPPLLTIDDLTASLSPDAPGSHPVFFDHPLPPNSSTYYFELTLISLPEGSKNELQLGLTSALAPHFTAFPSMLPYSFQNTALGYNSCGEIVASNWNPTSCPKLVEGDVVGIWVDFDRELARFTRNGSLIEEFICKDVKGALLGTVNLVPGAKVRANLGGDPWLFKDFEGIAAETKGTEELRFCPEVIEDSSDGVPLGSFDPDPRFIG